MCVGGGEAGVGCDSLNYVKKYSSLEVKLLCINNANNKVPA